MYKANQKQFIVSKMLIIFKSCLSIVYYTQLYIYPRAKYLKLNRDYIEIIC